jgi:hypothetical protein
MEDTNFDEGSLVHGSRDNRIAYIRTNRGEVLRSIDNGNFSLITLPTIMEGINKTLGMISRIARGALMPDGTYMMYMWSAVAERTPNYRQMIWRTCDGGSSFQLLPILSYSIDSIIPHPVFPSTAIATQFTAVPSRTQLLKTIDAGATFIPIFKPLVYGPRVLWAPTPSHPYRLIVPATLGITTASSAFWNNKVLQSDNFFDDYRVLVDRVHYWRVTLVEQASASQFSRRTVLIDQQESSIASFSNSSLPRETWPTDGPPEATMHVFASRFPSPNNYNQLNVEITRDAGYTYEFPSSAWQKTFFPRGGYYKSDPYGYQVYSVQENTTYVLAFNRDEQHDLYRIERQVNSDLSTFLLLRDHRPNTFVESQQLPGTMIADQLHRINETERTGAIHSVVSGNKGASWQVLYAPSSNAITPLYLTLTGVNNLSPLIYSAPNGIGSIFVTATVVNETQLNLPLKYSAQIRPPVSTYFTNDGGFTWKEIGEGYHVPEFAANGAMWVTAKQGDLSDSVNFSLDDGLSWREFRFSDFPIRIYNIRVASDYNSRAVLVHAVRTWAEAHPAPPSPPLEPMEANSTAPDSSPMETSPLEPTAGEDMPHTDSPSVNPTVPTAIPQPSSSPLLDSPYVVDPFTPSNDSEPTVPPVQPWRFESFLITLDFSKSFPLCDESHLETWIPVDAHGRGRCTMGEKLTFKRRKKGAFCFPQPSPSEDQSGHTWPILVSRDPCECTAEDYECAPCFQRNEENGLCQFSCGLESSSFLSQYGSIPWKHSVCDHNSNGFYEWPDSAAFAHRKVEGTKCRGNPVLLGNAIVPCKYAPEIPTPENPPTKPPFSISSQTRRTLEIVFITGGIIFGGFIVIRFFPYIRSGIGLVMGCLIPSRDDGAFGDMDFQDFDLDLEPEEVELDEIPVAETTTSSEEDEPNMDQD